MKFTSFLLFLAATCPVVQADITAQECRTQGGTVVSGSNIFDSSYVCSNSGQAPTDKVIATQSQGVAFAADAEVCCGGTGDGINSAQNNNNMFGHAFGGEEDVAGTEQETTCATDSDCPAIQCFVAPCPTAICVEGTCQTEVPEPNNEAELDCTQDSDCPVINCVAPPCNVNMCNENGICQQISPQQQDGTNNTLVGLFNGATTERIDLTRAECSLDYNGILVADVDGSGAIFELDYLCDSNGQPPIGNIGPRNTVSGNKDGNPMANSNGEVCCGPELEPEVSAENILTNNNTAEESSPATETTTTTPESPPAVNDEMEGSILSSSAKTIAPFSSLMFAIGLLVLERL